MTILFFYLNLNVWIGQFVQWIFKLLFGSNNLNWKYYLKLLFESRYINVWFELWKIEKSDSKCQIKKSIENGSKIVKFKGEYNLNFKDLNSFDYLNFISKKFPNNNLY